METSPVNTPRIGIIVGATRPGHKAGSVARWVHGIAAERPGAAFEVVDIADFALPHLDEPVPARMGTYTNAHTVAWAEKVRSLDGFVFVTPEYNASIPGVLKNAIDYLAAEWGGKPAGFVGYGMQGGVRAVAHLRVVLDGLEVADVEPAVGLTLPEDFENFTVFKPAAHRTKEVLVMLDALLDRFGRAG
ncbi:NAD(P)H-dependent oxidoreductase [Streptomyces sp. RerS4]|uniref:NADPH-dependent FMN reductase n=1 Tax=Streptomyces sp. RerS4 TaxID=2942449 RepID=UPI00201C7261|nr:NAD(P)H-dependent oxidoreductase [Streptomyces sp. RerS4]UQX03428.1 NAD(P)H-dependent oxidoreductase [Streptomyces sp. RerS4]